MPRGFGPGIFFRGSIAHPPANLKIRSDRPGLLPFMPVNGIEQLCVNCGLCCDSTLFADVELRAGDDPKQLKKLGLSLQKKGRGKLAFAQPCACFDGQLCRIYGERPRRCRMF